MDIEQVRQLVEHATTTAFWTAAPEGYAFGLATGGYIIWRLNLIIRDLRAELRRCKCHEETAQIGLLRLERRTAGGSL